MPRNLIGSLLPPSAVRAVVVVAPTRGFGFLLGVAEIVEEFGVQEFIPKLPVEVFDVSVLRGLPWLDVHQADAIACGTSRPRPVSRKVC